jgi:hypothetical protein
VTEVVTENVSAHVGTTVSCNACEEEKRNRQYRWRRWRLEGWDAVHCLTCHGYGHRECEVCGVCLPRAARFDRLYCSSTCRGRARKERELQALERAAWAAENPEEAAKWEADRQAWLEGLAKIANAAEPPGAGARRRCVDELQRRAEHCAGGDWDRDSKTHTDCMHVFAAGEVIYRRREDGPYSVETPVLPYCARHRCSQSDGYHNRDAGEGRYYRSCACDDSHWTTPEPCLGCGRLVSHPKNARWRQRSRYWEHAEPRVFCGTDCKRRVVAVEARSRRLAAAAERDPLRCTVCHREFEATRPDARYCSNRCRQRAYRKRKLEATA